MAQFSGDFEEKEKVDWVMGGKEAPWSPTVFQALGGLGAQTPLYLRGRAVWPR